MPKDRRMNFLSSDRARASPYACSSKDSNHGKLGSPLPPVGDEKEWEEARCPICMEHPHNAVLLLCTSNDKGCRPYMCDTSYRHSNCLDQFCKSFAGSLSTELQDVIVARMLCPRGRGTQMLLRPTRSTGGQFPEILCPLCRGQISGWVVIENARSYMNSKVRSCSLESCNFTGNYSELRKHARCKHPAVKPSDVDPERQSEWVKLEHERDIGDALSVVQSQDEYDMYNYSPDSTSASSTSDEAEDEQSEEDSGISVDFDDGVEFTFSLLNEFTFGPSYEGRSSTSTGIGARSLNTTSMRPRSRAYFPGGINSPRGRNTTPSRSDSGEVRERTGTSGRLNRRLMRLTSRSNDQVEIGFPRRWNTRPSRSAGLRNTTSNERTGGRSLGRMSIRTRSRSIPRAEVTPPRMARNTGNGRISGSFGSRSNP